MIAGVDIAIVLHRQRSAASFREVAQSTWSADPFAQSYVKELHICFTDIAFYPFIENFNQEITIGLRWHSEFRHFWIFLSRRCLR